MSNASGQSDDETKQCRWRQTRQVNPTTKRSSAGDVKRVKAIRRRNEAVQVTSNASSQSDDETKQWRWTSNVCSEEDNVSLKHHNSPNSCSTCPISLINCQLVNIRPKECQQRLNCQQLGTDGRYDNAKFTVVDQLTTGARVSGSFQKYLRLIDQLG